MGQRAGGPAGGGRTQQVGAIMNEGMSRDGGGMEMQIEAVERTALRERSGRRRAYGMI